MARTHKLTILLLGICCALAACGGSGPGARQLVGPDDLVEPSSAAEAPAPTSTIALESTTTTLPLTGIEVSQQLGKGMNLGNSLEAPREGDWGAGLDESHFSIIAEAGFDHVRLPVSWAGYADTEAPYTILDGFDPKISGQPYTSIWERVDWAIDQAEQNDLMIIVNNHHYDAAHVDPSAHADRLIAMWDQIAQRYANAGDHVVFELFNEPHDAFTDQPELWNELLADVLAVVRETNPTRGVVIGPAGFNSIDFLDELVLPDDDYLVATVHLYEPFSFTHQGATWISPVPAEGVPWSVDGLSLKEGVFDKSWNSRTITENGQLRIDFSQQWGGFSVDFDEAIAPQELSFQVAGNGSLRVGCRIPDSDEINEAEIVTTSQAQDFAIDLSGCPPESTGVSLMNSHPSSAPLFITDFEVCSEVRGCEGIVTSADLALRRWVERAAEWSADTGVPIHLGEFGAFGGEGQVPMADRAAWTSTVVDEANKHGIPFSYWEFHAGYGAYDLDRGAWNDPLLDALLS